MKPTVLAPGDAPPPEPTAAADEPAPLELNEQSLAHARQPKPLPAGLRPVGPEDALRSAPRHPGLGRLGRTLLMVAALGLATAWVWHAWDRGLLVALEPAQKGATLAVESVPSGARVLFEGKELGRTPYFGDNGFPAGRHQLRLVLPGYRPQPVPFQGGRFVKVRVRLERAAKPAR